MKLNKVIKAATLEKYNANNRGNNVGDCVKRSMSLAFDIPYVQIGKMLVDKMKEKRQSAWNIRPVFTSLIDDLGGQPYTAGIQSDFTVDQFVDNEADPGKTYLLLVGKKPGSTSHLVCIRDGRIWDSWDCRDYFVTECWTVPQSTKELTDIKDHLDELRIGYLSEEFENEVAKQMHKWGMSGDFYFNDAIKGYAIKIHACLELPATDSISKNRVYRFDIAFPIEPTMSIQEAEEFIRKTGKVRIYDRLYAIAQQEKKLEEEYAMRAKVGAVDNRLGDLIWMDGREKKFYNTLPGWARALVTYVTIREPGQYHDSYRVKMRVKPDDDAHPDLKSFYLEGYEASHIRDMIERYGKYNEIEGYDYSYDF